MKRFFDDPEIVSRSTELAARILREIAMASEAGSAEIRLLFRQDWRPNKYRAERGLGVHIECGREDSFLLVTKLGSTPEFSNTLATVLGALAKLMAGAWESGGMVDRRLWALLNEHEDGL
jgi:hypothetical protein